MGRITPAQQNGPSRIRRRLTRLSRHWGRTAYQANCVACHAPDLSGREGPQLAGANFMSQWDDKTAGELINFMRATMPPGADRCPIRRALISQRSCSTPRARPGLER